MTKGERKKAARERKKAALAANPKKAQAVYSRRLDLYNVKNYNTDIDYINRLSVKQSTKEWIELAMYEHRAKANIYELNFAEFLLERKVRFIHQAPFVFGGKIYFADFYLPDHHLVVEIDGDYHNGEGQYNYDKIRERNFASVKISTERISNHTTTSDSALSLIMSKYKIK